jgi:hypothetical protein
MGPVAICALACGAVVVVLFGFGVVVAEVLE